MLYCQTKSCFGSSADTALTFHSQTGYRWGGVEDAKTIGLWLGVLLCMAAAICALMRGRGWRSGWTAPTR